MRTQLRYLHKMEVAAVDSNRLDKMDIMDKMDGMDELIQ